MKSRKHKKRKCTKQTSLTCPKCRMALYTIGHYKDHMKSSKICRSNNPFTCNFCDYIEIDSNGLNQHLVKNLSCAFHYEELKSYYRIIT